MYSTQEKETAPKLLTPDEFWRQAKKRYGPRAHGRVAVYRAIHQGLLRSVQVGSHYRIPASELTEFFEREARRTAEQGQQ